MAAPEIMPARLSSKELSELQQAIGFLESATFASRIANLLGRQAQMIGRALPAPARRLVAGASQSAMKGALKLALKTMETGGPAQEALDPNGGLSSRVLHKAAAAASGAVGGAFGLAALPLELPISTTILLRSIAQIARSAGEDLRQPDAALACLEVFALGNDAGASGVESGYFAIRAALARSVNESARFLVQKGVVDEAAPALIRFATQIAARFGVVVSEKLVAQAVPVLGAIGGAAVNLAFAEHFQNLARGHFIVRRLERAHGADAVRFEYQRLQGKAL